VKTFLRLIVAVAWFAVVLWSAETFLIQAKRKKDWGKVGIAVLSATTVAGSLLILMPERVFFRVYTTDLGFALALISAVVILALLMSRWT